jgi:hypothetical protein
MSLEVTPWEDSPVSLTAPGDASYDVTVTDVTVTGEDLLLVFCSLPAGQDLDSPFQPNERAFAYATRATDELAELLLRVFQSNNEPTAEDFFELYQYGLFAQSLFATVEHVNYGAPHRAKGKKGRLHFPFPRTKALFALSAAGALTALKWYTVCATVGAAYDRGVSLLYPTQTRSAGNLITMPPARIDAVAKALADLNYTWTADLLHGITAIVWVNATSMEPGLMWRNNPMYQKFEHAPIDVNTTLAKRVLGEAVNSANFMGRQVNFLLPYNYYYLETTMLLKGGAMMLPPAGGLLQSTRTLCLYLFKLIARLALRKTKEASIALLYSAAQLEAKKKAILALFAALVAIARHREKHRAAEALEDSE